MTEIGAEDREAIEVSVILPAYNEVATLGATVTTLVTALEERGVAYEIIVVENGSSDGTLRLARMLAAQLPQVRVLTLPIGDYGAALAAGFAAARGEFVVSFDVDYYDIGFLDKSIQLLKGREADVVVASKRAPGSQDHRSGLRRAGTTVFTSILRHGFALPVSDAHGMKAFLRAPLAPIAASCKTTESLFDVEMVIRAAQAGLRVIEVPTVVQETRPARTAFLGRAVQASLGLLTLQRALDYPAIQEIKATKAVKSIESIKNRRSKD